MWDSVERDDVSDVEPGQASDRPGDSTAANILLPVSTFLTGDLLLLGPASADLRAAIGTCARAVTCHAGMPPEAEDLEDAARHDAIVAVDLLVPAGSAHGSDAGAGDGIAGGLARLRRRLRPDGHLILILENPRALRPGPETRFPSPVHARAGTPRRSDLDLALCEVGLRHQDWWFPFPDHRAARTLLSERGLSPGSGLDAGALAGEACAARGAWRRLAEAGSLADHAPAFLVVASEGPLPADRRLALHLGYSRRPEFGKVATITAREDGGASVLRRPRRPGLPRRVAGITNRFPDEDLAPGRPWPETLEGILAHDGWDLSDVEAWGERWLGALRAAFLDERRADPDTTLPGHAFDAIPRNLLVAGDRSTFIDLEWEPDAPVDLAHVLVRGALDTLLTLDVAGLPRPGLDPTLLTVLRAMTASLGHPLDEARIAEGLDREIRFQAVVSGRETGRDLAWLAATHLLPRARLLTWADGHARAFAALRADHSEALRLGDEARRQTDNAIAYAAELDRAVERLEAALARAEARPAGTSPVPTAARAGLGRWLRTHLLSGRT